MSEMSFLNIQDLYNYLEEESHNFSDLNQIGKYWQKLRDYLHKNNRDDEAEIAQTELAICSFDIMNGTLTPLFSSVDKDGRVKEWPCLKDFTEEEYSYIKNRIDNVETPILKARYSHVLWESVHRHRKYADSGIKAYLESVDLYKKSGLDKPSEQFELSCKKAIASALQMAKSIKDPKQIALCKNKLLDFLFNLNKESSVFVNVFVGLVNLITENYKIFDLEDGVSISDLMIIQIESFKSKGEFFFLRDIAELGLQLADKKIIDSSICYDNLAFSCESLCHKMIEGNKLAAIDFCLEAIKWNKKVGNKEKIDELVALYEKLITGAKYSTKEFEFDISSLIEHCKKIADDVVSKDTEYILRFLMTSGVIIPSIRHIKKNIDDDADKFSFLKLAAHQIVDEQGHTVQHFSTSDENEYFLLLQQYKFYLQTSTFHLIKEILFKAINAHILTFHQLIKYLKDNSWVSQDLYLNVNHDESIKYNWLNQIIPGIYEYFYQMEHHFCNSEFIPNFIISIDSLILKVEGMLRDVCRLSGVSVTQITTDRSGKNISKLKDIHMLLYEEKVIELFSEDDLLLFRYVLVEQAGYNLRHKVAHGMMLLEDYNLQNMHLVILILLRLSRYKIKKMDDDKNEK